MTNQKNTKDSQTAGENVYQYLRTSIIELQVKPGQTININELSDFLKVSRSPIRDALIQLAKDGLVTTTPQKGTIVSKIDVQRVKDERFMRACIEERVLEEFLKSYQESHIEKLKEILEQQKLTLENKDARGFLRTDDAFHTVFFQATSHPFCLENVLNMSSHYFRIRLLSLSEPDIRKQTYGQHKEILQLIQERNISKIRQLIDLHIVEKKDEETRMKHKYPDLFTGIEEPDQLKGKIWEEDFLMTV
ncbi:GntR family transcriptional regulator [Faecalispora anaeroviscerum]|uniref:GntR family transcriptional regulator n=1 Tax=Faecalispora anaeroviscerum TaxID=2991836 RepID=UPI0024BB39E3|nr:GntR family transcriptional regulator [Faecalispora anaeroviscerum]